MLILADEFTLNLFKLSGHFSASRSLLSASSYWHKASFVVPLSSQIRLACSFYLSALDAVPSLVQENVSKN